MHQGQDAPGRQGRADWGSSAGCAAYLLLNKTLASSELHVAGRSVQTTDVSFPSGVQPMKPQEKGEEEENRQSLSSGFPPPGPHGALCPSAKSIAPAAVSHTPSLAPSGFRVVMAISPGAPQRPL